MVRDLSTVVPVGATDPDQIQECIAHSYYTYEGNSDPKHPWGGQTNLNYTGPKPPYDYLNIDQYYSWLKTPRRKFIEEGVLDEVEAEQKK